VDSGVSPAGYVLKANGSGTSVFGLLDASSFPANVTAGTYILPTLTLDSAGVVVAVTRTDTISATNFYASGTLAVSGTSSFKSALDAPAVSTSAITGPAGKSVAKAWVNFRGDGSNGASATILSSYNVASVVKNGIGDYTISFTTPMPDANYLVTGSAGSSVNSGMSGISYGVNTSYTANTARIRVGFQSGFVDGVFTQVVIYGN
jgi:hypothetical protein